MTLMSAVRAHSFGGPDVLVVDRIPVPAPGPGQVLVRVEAAGVNFADVMRRRDDLYPFPTSLPYAPGADIAGTVEALGQGVSGPPVGTPVFALAGDDGSGGYAQYAVAGAATVVPIPPGLSVDEAAGVVVAGATAVLSLQDVGELADGETVLIEGAGGGVGGYAVQIAKLLGATVVATASTPERREAALKLGADHAVDPTAPGWMDTVREVAGGRGVDLAFHVSGGDVLGEVLGLLAPFGRVVVAGRAGGASAGLGGAALDAFLYRPSLNQSLRVFNLGLWFGMRPEAAGAALGRLIGWVASGRVRVPVGPVLPLSRAAEAHRMIEERRSTGKVVLKPWQD
jgi:NADPH:quinone reductase-like Zn-dependent oxidoreductase